MVEEKVIPATTSTEAVETEESLLSNSGSSVVSEGESVLDTAGAEEKAAQEAENKRLLETEDKQLTPEEVTKKAGLVKVKEAADAKALLEQKQKGVPEKYEIKPPEGQTLDEAALTKAAPVFKGLGLTNAQVQGISDYYAQVVKEVATAAETKFKEWNEGNIKETMSALGTNSKTELAFVAKVKNLYSPETIEALNASGIGNLKCFILDSAKIGRMFSEERIVNDNKGVPGGTKDAAAILYPSMSK